MSSRHALAPARPVDDHRRRIEDALRPLADRAAETVPIDRALDRRLAADVYAPMDLPVFRNSAMDGYAVQAESVAVVPATLPLAGVVAAGNTEQVRLAPGTAVKVMTGAPVPPGADCVVPVEHTESDGVTVTIRTSRATGDFVREPGTDVRAGQLLAAAGTLLRPRHIAALAAVGLGELPALRRVRAAVITTGDELRPAGATLLPGQIFNSNGIALAAALSDNGVEVVSVTHATDDHADFRARLDAAVATADVVFTSGGVSMGDFEVVKEVLTPLGGEFGSVAMQPGGPQGLSLIEGVPVLSFPGNPVSTMVSFEIFARPLLRELAGLPAIPISELPLLESVRSPAGKRQFLRGRLAEGGVAPVSGQGSHLIAAMAHADVLVDIPADATEVPAGTIVEVRPL
ncbi:molybdopterin molybdotransferase MoeA [Nocardia seriolae]|uniref:Molybdopterin molybdenumtransferase n=1 Tax=Nocardia seriolae TaxID=37332 RepID=A0ABC9YQ52_9NOCA|nr:gephyrin-like molybdotransferase Glp [Nocardia seriolae]BEK97864.1 molybdopterin molybdotransferase MoeA [Nocardia seriolae]GAM45452.1 molybdenum cofactor biosynthesis protein MoeA [Nocardia seriolae]GAP27475.1 molybdenum cofactor biosynthesis protein MoeA [Nocardia seriolae]